MYKDVMSIVKMILFSPEKLKLRNVSSAWLLSLIYEGSDLTMGVMTFAEWFSFVSNQGQGSSSASILGTDWPNHVELGTRLFESIDTWGRTVQFCV